MNCEECKGLLSSYMDNELDRDRSAAVLEHLACARLALMYAAT